MDVMDDKRDWIEGLIGQYQGPLIRYAMRITNDLERAREVVQDTFMRLWESDNPRLAEFVAPWLYTVCRNRAFDVCAKHNPARQAAVSALETVDHAKAPNGEKYVLGKKVLQTLNGLPPNQQEVVRLKFQDGFSYKEISSITGLSTSNVGYLIHVAIGAIRDKLGIELPASLAMKRSTS